MKREERRSCFRIASQSQSARDSSVLLELFLKERLYEMKKDLITVLFKLFLILLLAEGICYAYEGFCSQCDDNELASYCLGEVPGYEPAAPQVSLTCNLGGNAIYKCSGFSIFLFPNYCKNSERCAGHLSTNPYGPCFELNGPMGCKPKRG